MKNKLKGVDLLINKSIYNIEGIREFNELLGVIPVQYESFLLNYKTNNPSFIHTEDDTEFEIKVFSEKFNKSLFLDYFYSLPQVVGRINIYDRAYTFSGNHRKFRILPFCTSGSSYLEYFISQPSGAIYAINPNHDLDEEFTNEEFEEKFMIFRNFEDFINNLIVEVL